MDFLLSNSWPLIIVGVFTVGFLVGLTGVGAGSLMTPFLISGIGIYYFVKTLCRSRQAGFLAEQAI